MKKVNLLLLATTLVGVGSIGSFSTHSSADSISKVRNTQNDTFKDTSLSVSYPDGTWGDVSTSSFPVKAQYDFQNHKISVKVSSPANGFNASMPTFQYNLIYKITGNDTGKVYLQGQDTVFAFENMNFLNLKFTDSDNHDKSYTVEATSIEILEGIHPSVLPYTKEGCALVVK